MGVLDDHAEKWCVAPNGCWVWTGAVSGSGQQRAVVGLPRLLVGGFRQKNVGVARLVCEEVYGPPPTPKHHAAHATPNGCIGGVCVSPHHIRWATPSENQQDIHPTVMKERLRKANTARLGG